MFRQHAKLSLKAINRGGGLDNFKSIFDCDVWMDIAIQRKGAP
jgi:hypothetical protein